MQLWLSIFQSIAKDFKWKFSRQYIITALEVTFIFLMPIIPVVKILQRRSLVEISQIIAYFGQNHINDSQSINKI